MDNVALTLLLTIVAALLVIAVVVLYRKLGQKEAELAALASDAEGMKKERDQARQESKDLQKKKEKLESEAQGLRDELDGLKKELHKAKQESKSVAAKPIRGPATPDDRDALRMAMTDLEKLREDNQGLKEKVKALEVAAARTPARATEEKAEAPAEAKPAAAPLAAPASAEPDPKLVRKVDQLEGQLDRLKKELGETRDRLRVRERDLRAARKSSVSNDRAFRVTQGKLQAMKEKLAHLEPTPAASSEPTPAPEA